MKKQLIGFIVCSLLLCTIPLAAGINIATENDEEPASGLLGWAWIRGWVMSPRELGNYMSGRAIRVHFIDFSGLETKAGIIKVKLISFKTGAFLKIDYFGPIGALAYVHGFVHGGIDVQE